MLNLTKNKPTGGRPVKEKINSKKIFLVGIYFCKKIIKVGKEECVIIFNGSWVKAKISKLRKILRYIMIYSKLNVNITF